MVTQRETRQWCGSGLVLAVVLAVLTGSVAAGAAGGAWQTNDLPRLQQPPILIDSLAGRDSLTGTAPRATAPPRAVTDQSRPS